MGGFMAPRLIRFAPCLLEFVTACFVFAAPATAQTIWSGLTKSFVKAASTDPSLPANQDPLTPAVKLTRGSAGGLINIASESFFTPTTSPALTLWATDLNNAGQTIAATNYQNLTFTNWLDAFGGQHTGGASIPNRAAVVRLVSDNIYLDLKFTSWTTGVGEGYAYLRAEPPAPEPSGDYNGNGLVDAADYVLWRHTLGRNNVPPGTAADGNANGEIDAGDYTHWRERFGTEASGASFDHLAAVPEPEYLLTVLIGCSVLLVARYARA
jgi:hypothetical protein